MMRAVPAVLLVLGVGVLGGCVTAQTPGAGTFSAAPAKAGHAAVYIGRPHGWNTSLIPLEIELDGRPLVQLGFNEYTRIELRPGRHSVGAPDSFRTRATAGTPHAVQLTIEAGKTYYLLPSRWVENVRPTITMVGTTPVATTTADRHSSFTVQASLSSAAPPAAFLPLSFVAPAAN
jgi:Protein of unknown function (DUF2846)